MPVLAVIRPISRYLGLQAKSDVWYRGNYAIEYIIVRENGELLLSALTGDAHSLNISNGILNSTPQRAGILYFCAVETDPIFTSPTTGRLIAIIRRPAACAILFLGEFTGKRRDAENAEDHSLSEGRVIRAPYLSNASENRGSCNSPLRRDLAGLRLGVVHFGVDLGQALGQRVPVGFARFPAAAETQHGRLAPP